MATFHITAHDKQGALAVRQANRAAHLEWVNQNLDQIKMGGPILSDTDGSMIGSILVIDAPDRAALDAFLSDDPYAKAGLFEKVEIRTFKWLIGVPV